MRINDGGGGGRGGGIKGGGAKKIHHHHHKPHGTGAKELRKGSPGHSVQDTFTPTNQCRPGNTVDINYKGPTVPTDKPKLI